LHVECIAECPDFKELSKKQHSAGMKSSASVVFRPISLTKVNFTGVSATFVRDRLFELLRRAHRTSPTTQILDIAYDVAFTRLKSRWHTNVTARPNYKNHGQQTEF